MATQSQGIKQLMAAEKEAAKIVADARKSKRKVALSVGLQRCKIVCNWVWWPVCLPALPLPVM